MLDTGICDDFLKQYQFVSMRVHYLRSNVLFDISDAH